MQKLTKEQLILLADRLINDAEKKDPELYAKEKFTGGAVLTAFHYGKISYKVDLYYGYGRNKNPIHCKMNIDENIAYHVFNAINERCKRSIEEDTYSVDLLNDIVTTSLRSRTAPYKDKKRYDIDKDKIEIEESLPTAPFTVDPWQKFFGEFETKARFRESDRPLIMTLLQKIPEDRRGDFLTRCDSIQSEIVKDGKNRYGAENLIKEAMQTIDKPEKPKDNIAEALLRWAEE